MAQLVPSQARDEFVIELDHTADPIAGRLRLADGREHAFIGYVELIALLETLMRKDEAL